ncbi:MULTISPECIES: DUF4350 domain-containing protein [unclassified Arcicella]|uniref:DUF4350 domain-containing protein n=1 Tax=unclassified Arcicella TaxID=2644986 RepID=UPI00285D285E|nr:MULTISPECIES: DUF4350 domain-containing protein [unclassified Arcicella]MDR6562060.1 hypothetical protein [Arcicella sp. BE51]MDR6811932.1 hypothetical protein [Arcicella sp. BE140]MDR6822962.1 hypothetical protein [Arcicella sp. BE139]
MQKNVIIALLALIFSSASLAQQIQDTTYEPNISSSAYPFGKGSSVKIDEAHYNFHTASNRYLAFAKVLRKDGYEVSANKEAFSEESINKAKILVIANAIHPSDTTEWVVPNPSAFTPKEIIAVKNWVEKGGSLLLIADHQPFPGAASELGKAFGFTFYNGFATDTTTGKDPNKKKELDTFTKKAGSLKEHQITNKIDHIVTFTGQAFKIPSQAKSLLTFDDKYIVLLPDTAWKFSPKTPRISAKGLSQGAVLSVGKGRVAVFGEAAQFTAQLKGKDKKGFGLNAPEADQNLAFLLNIIHWLDKKE